MPHWSKDDLEALERLVARYGAAKVAEKARASAPGRKRRSRGQPPDPLGNRFAIWTEVQVRRRAATGSRLSVEKACKAIAEDIRRVTLPPHQSAGSIEDYYWRASTQIKRSPEQFGHLEQAITGRIERGEIRGVPLRMRLDGDDLVGPILDTHAIKRLRQNR